MGKDSRSYRKRSRSKSRERSKRSKRSRSRERKRSRDRKRSRSRSRDRKRSRSRDRKRSRSRDRKRSKSRERRKKDEKRRSRSREKRKTSASKDRSKSKSPDKKHDEGALRVKDEPLDKEEEQKRLEMEMQKRRERIEQWRAERNKEKELVPINIAPPSKKWSLEDDDDDDDDVGNNKNDGDDDELDPLDAYMQSVTDEVKKTDNVMPTEEAKNNTTGGSKVTIITAVAKKKVDSSLQKGELMLNNVDLMEYSSEEEEEDLDLTMANMNKKKKELVSTDHSKVYYAPFRKDFYVEVPELARLSPEEVDALRDELEGIKVRGKNCPKPIKEWAQAGVSKKVLDALKRSHFDNPTPIQAQAIPAIMSGRDLIGIAKTGSGKTLAFLLPMFRHILDQPELDDEDGPIVFSRKENKDVAVRNQLPLKLAFALTIHKSQGMTLDRLEVDCSGIFKAGQLGVAIGRARTSTELRVINFSPRACMPHPESVETFLSLPSSEPLSDKSCCQIPKRIEENPSFFSASETECGIETDIDLDFEPDFDEEFDEVIKSIDTTECDVLLPDDLNIDSFIDKIKVINVLTPFQMNTNAILQNLNTEKLKEFAQRECKKISALIEKVTFQGPVKCQKLGEFYTAIHEYHNSAEFMFSCMKLFENESFTAEHKHVCFNISVEIRKFLLSKRAELYTSTSTKVAQRTVTNASRARVRYIGGYCIAKIRSKFVNKKESLRYSKSIENQQSYEEAVYISKILGSFREDEQYILKNSVEPESLLDISRRQYTNRGLTNISDELFHFFICLSEQCLKTINDENFNKHGNQMFEMCKNEIFQDEKLRDIFKKVFDRHSVFEPSELLAKQINIDRQAVGIVIYQKIVKLFLMVLFGQFRKDILDVYKVTKKMAHRKQIQVSKTSVASKKAKKKTESVAENVKTKADKRKRGDTTEIQISSKKTRSPQPSTSQTHSPQPSPPLDSPQPSTSQAHSPQPSPPLDSPQPSTSQAHSPPSPPQDFEASGDANEDNALCKICLTEERDSEWIQCDNCSGWLHRSCAGLKHHMKWKRFQKKGAVFNCYECQ